MKRLPLLAALPLLCASVAYAAPLMSVGTSMAVAM